MNYRNIIEQGTLILKKNLITTPNIDSELLLSKTLNKPREKILLNLENKLSLKQIIKYRKYIDKRKNRVPMSIILGKKSFYDIDFLVNNRVLTPRFETEILVEEIFKYYKFCGKINILDIGLGSGCILISLLKQESSWTGTGIDISASALDIAKTNAKIQHVSNRIRFINSDVDKFSQGKYDLIVSNPPYINKIGYNNLDIGVKGFEPITALYGGVDGLKIIQKVINKSKVLLKKGGLLAMEIGLGQSYKVSDLLKANGFFVSKIIKDYQGIKRFIFSIKIK